MDGGESVRSGRSERSERSHRSHGSNHHGSGGYRQYSRPQAPPHPGSNRSMSRGQGYDLDREDRSVTIITQGQEIDMERGVGEERIEVQVIPQDDNWGDNTTAITGNTSETGFSAEDLPKFYVKDIDSQVGVNCARHLGTALTVCLSAIAFLSPIVMLLLPKLGIVQWREDVEGASECQPECEGLLISFAFKLLVLLVGALALFFRKPRATMPRVFVFRAIVLFLVFILTFAFWLFYGVRVFKEQQGTYEGVVMFALSLVDCLLFVHYVAIILLEIRQLQPQFVVRVVRSPDGEAKVYSVGLLSIQRAAVHILEQYYKDFDGLISVLQFLCAKGVDTSDFSQHFYGSAFPNPSLVASYNMLGRMYNPYLENVTKKHSKHTSTAFKVYDIDGNASNQPANQGRNRAAFPNSSGRRREAGHNDRFYDEQEYERKVRKRRARLLVAAEEAFTHIKRMHDEQGPAIPMDPNEAAAAVFPSLARALQKYLRVTRQQPRYTMDSVLSHLACIISHDMSPRAFVSRYLTQGPVVCGSEQEVKSSERWVLACDQLLTRELSNGTIFQLKKGPVSLLCSVTRVPHFSLTEEMIHPKSNRFVLRMNSETSV